MESNLSPDPNDTTHALLTQLVQIGLGNLTAAGSIPAAPASMWSPSTVNIRIQFIAYASLSMSSLAAFRAMLSKQWLKYYKYYRYAAAWRMNEQSADKRSLTLSLILFGVAISANTWHAQYTIAWVIIATMIFGFLFYP